MEKTFWRRSIRQVLLSALVYTVFCLFATALCALIHKAYGWSDGAVVAANWTIKCVGIFLCCLLLIGQERALLKGAAAGLLGSVCTLFVFAAVGGGFHVTAFFALELPVVAILGGSGGLAGAKLHKN